MANIPGVPGYVQPGVFARVRTITRSVTVPGGTRIPCIVGLGEYEETLVLSAEGGGADGLSPDYQSSVSPDGRHFQVSKTALIPGRTTVYKNGVPLSGYEATITSSAFDSRYDYRLQPALGYVELQRASILDQGGLLAKPSTGNVGNGFDVGNDGSTLSLIDSNAPAETWTFRCTSVIRDAYGDPVSGNAVFTVSGSVSGVLLDAYGAPIVWTSDSVERDNGILRAKIVEGATPFDRGDRFTVIVNSGVLSAGDTLSVRTIATQDLNDAEYFTDANALYAKHGQPSTDNTLSLGAALAFENGAPGVFAVQAKPPLPRRTIETVQEADNLLTTTSEGLPALTTPPTPLVADIQTFKYPLSGVPDADTSVNITIIDGTDGTETQIFPTKVDFYSSSIGDGDASHWSDFIDIASSGYNYSYTVVLDDQVEDQGVDGEVTSDGFTFTADSASFQVQRSGNQEVGESDVGKKIRIHNFDRYGNDVSDVAGTYTIASVGDYLGDSTIVTFVTGEVNSGLGWASSNTDLVWELVDTADTSAYLLLTYDLYTSGAMGEGDGIKVSYITQDDADFYDANWADAFEELEKIDAQIIVPLPNTNYSAIQQATKTHVELMSSVVNKRERVAFIGALPGVTAAALVGDEEVAVEDLGVVEGIQGDDAAEVLAGNIEDLTSYDVAVNWGGGFRTVFFYPDEIIRAINGTNTVIPGFYIGAAAAGYLAARGDVQEPLTFKTLSGFSIARSKRLSNSMKNRLGANGVCVLEAITGGGRVLHGKTTTSSGVAEEEEISVVFIRDRVAYVLRRVLERFVGKADTPTLLTEIMSAVDGALNSLQSEYLITARGPLDVARDEVDPRQVNVYTSVVPNVPLNTAFIDVGVGQVL